jgi:Gly-Xaa carboxypeptidase
MVLNRMFHQPCAMHPRVRPDITEKNVVHLFPTRSFQDDVARRLAESVKVPCITYDGMGHVGEDPRWEVFYQFSDCLKRLFPRM